MTPFGITLTWWSKKKYFGLVSLDIGKKEMNVITSGEVYAANPTSQCVVWLRSTHKLGGTLRVAVPTKGGPASDWCTLNRGPCCMG